MSTSQAHIVFMAIFTWFMLVLSGCATTDQYGCTSKQNRQATRHYYIAKSKCPGRVDLLYRSENPAHDSSYTETVYLPGEVVTQTDTLIRSDTLLIDGYYYITRTINRHTLISKTDTARQTQYNTRTITVTNPAPQQENNLWLWIWAIGATALLGLALLKR